MVTNSVFLKDMPFMLEVGKDAWLRDGKVQPVKISLRVDVSSIDDAATLDDVSKSLDYGKLYKNIQARLDNQKSYSNVRDLTWCVSCAIDDQLTRMSIEITLPKAALRADGGIRHTLELKPENPDGEFVTRYETLQIRNIKCACIIGVNPHERNDKQMVVVGVTFRAAMRIHSELSRRVVPSFPAAEIITNKSYDIIQMIGQQVERSSFQTVEALANTICRDVMMEWLIPEIEVSVEKPYAIPSIGAAGVCIRRRRSFYVDQISNEHDQME